MIHISCVLSSVDEILVQLNACGASFVFTKPEYTDKMQIIIGKARTTLKVQGFNILPLHIILSGQ